MSSRTPLPLCMAAIAILLLTHARADRTPCHKQKHLMGKGVTCEAPRVPHKMCRACLLDGWTNPGGHFNNCKAIYKLDTPWCRSRLAHYARLNRRCDPLRARQIRNMDSSADDREAVDYFVYSLCEMCCDCIPKGAKSGEWWMRKKKGTQFKVDRGNCPAHAWYDVCRIWPQAKWVLGQNEELPAGMDLDKMPPVCENTKKWRFSEYFTGWPQKAQTFIYPNMRQFYEQYMIAAGCGFKENWKQCVQLETDQRRL